MTTTCHIPPETLAALGLPKRDELNDEQQRGAACVWCGTALNGESAIDLGERPAPDRWFPRACRSCLLQKATRALLDHIAACKGRCGGVSGLLCDTGRVLNRLARGSW